MVNHLNSLHCYIGSVYAKDTLFHFVFSASSMTIHTYVFGTLFKQTHFSSLHYVYICFSLLYIGNADLKPMSLSLSRGK